MVLVKLCSLLVCVCAFSAGALGVRNRKEPIYSNEFAVHIPDGKEAADAIASKHGFVNRGQVCYRLLKLPDSLHSGALCSLVFDFPVLSFLYAHTHNRMKRNDGTTTGLSAFISEVICVFAPKSLFSLLPKSKSKQWLKWLVFITFTPVGNEIEALQNCSSLNEGKVN